VTLSQFGVANHYLEMPLKEVNKFYVAWHLYDSSVIFNVVTGLIEIIGAILLVFNRTVLLGTLLVLVMLGQIFIIDLSFTMNIHGYGLVLRILGMMIAASLILFYYKDRVIQLWNILTDKSISIKFQYKWWIFLILPIVGFSMDFVFAILMMPFKLLLEWLSN